MNLCPDLGLTLGGSQVGSFLALLNSGAKPDLLEAQSSKQEAVSPSARRHHLRAEFDSFLSFRGISFKDL